MSYKADSILRNQIFNFSMQILNIIFPLIAIPYTTRLFGPDILGEVNFANSIVQYFMIAAIAGIPVYATREIARNRDDNDSLRKIFKEISILQLIFTKISLVAYIILILSIENLRSNIYIYLFLGIQIFSNSFNFVWFIQGIEKYRYAAIATFISKFINVILIFTLLKNRKDYYIYALIIGITAFINIFINMIMSLSLLKNFKGTKTIKIYKEHLKIHVYAILVFFLSDIAVKVYTAMDQTMLGILDGKESVGYYSMSIRLVKVLLSFVTSLAVVMVPRISNSIKNNRESDAKIYIGMSTSLVYIIAIPAMFGIFAIGEEVVRLYLGKEFLQSIAIFKLVSLNLIIIGLSNVFGMQVMIPYGKEKQFTIILSFAAILNFIVNLILIPKFSYFGAAYATLMAEILVTSWMYLEVRKLIGDIKEVFKPWKMLIPSIIFYLVIKLGIKSVLTSDIDVILISIPVAGLIYAIGLILLKEKITMKVLNKIINKIKR
ncbi:flippase [Paraclostridium sordellii]|uniref:flippase n=1 Tax=Paraclostridium sordellii TaxID=1505 RepID=UPI00096A87BF|nr:flippase [Paeniclostridium sordellii]